VLIVTTPQHPFWLNLGFLLNHPVGYSHEFPFDLPQIQIPDDLDLRHFRGLVTVGRTPQGLLVQGTFQADLDLECARCLTTYEHTLHWEMTELYAFRNRSTSESDLVLPKDARIDLQPFIREDALLAVPITPICKPGCKGLCQVCGADLNTTECGHQAQLDKSSPFSALKNLLEK